MTTPKILLINGPPRSGKDTAGRYIKELMAPTSAEVVTLKFSTPVKVGALAAHGFTWEDQSDLEDLLDLMERRKDNPTEAFMGKSYRDAQIAISETYMKPLHGNRVYGDLLQERILYERDGLEEPHFVVTDSGFADEAMVLFERWGPEALTLIQMSRPDCDFSNDSRGYIELPGVETYEVKNDFGLDDLRKGLEVVLKHAGWLA